MEVAMQTWRNLEKDQGDRIDHVKARHVVGMTRVDNAY